jgi:hypothetical protein
MPRTSGSAAIPATRVLDLYLAGRRREADVLRRHAGLLGLAVLLRT